MNSKIKGSIFGGAIGDALGYQIEFKRNIKDKEVTRFKNIGIISDDTQMTLYTAEGLLYANLNNIPYEDAVYYFYREWLNGQNGFTNPNSKTWLSYIPNLNIPRAPGNTCIDALSSGKMGTIRNPLNNSKGCGTVMRIAPVGLFIKDTRDAGIVAAKVAAITHGHQQGLISSYVLAIIINLIVYDGLNIHDALNKSLEYLSHEKDLFSKKDVKDFLKLIEKTIYLSNKDYNDIDAIFELGEGWVADEALAIALYSCLKYEKSYEDAIVCAINHDGDSDSTGAIAGNIIGAYLGIENIPDYYLQNIELYDVIDKVADELINYSVKSL